MPIFRESRWSRIPGQGQVRTYDAENHVTSQTLPQGYEPGSNCFGGQQTYPGNDNRTYLWGPDGHLAQRSDTVTAYNGTTSTTTQTIGWDGDDILFGNGGISVEKLGVVSSATGSNGAVDIWSVYDRDATGSVANTHELGGFTGVNTTPWKAQCNGTGSGLNRVCTYAQRPSQGGPSDPQFTTFYTPPLSTQRSDGYSDGANVFQGVRAYDPNMNQWTTPDAYAGDVHDPMSQKPYMWNGNNPVQYSDPSGYCAEDACVIEGGIAIGATEVVVAGAIILGSTTHNQGATDFGKGLQTKINSAVSAGWQSLTHAFSHGDSRLPRTGTPGDTTRPDGKQVRTYGPNGEAQRDIDHGHDHNGAGDPHAHDWTNGQRGPARPLKPGEKRDEAFGERRLLRQLGKFVTLKLAFWSN